MTTFGLYGARLSLAVWRHFTCYIYFFLYSLLSLKNKYTILYYTNSRRIHGLECSRIRAREWYKRRAPSFFGISFNDAGPTARRFVSATTRRTKTKRCRVTTRHRTSPPNRFCQRTNTTRIRTTGYHGK